MDDVYGIHTMDHVDPMMMWMCMDDSIAFPLPGGQGPQGFTQIHNTDYEKNARFPETNLHDVLLEASHMSLEVFRSSSYYVDNVVSERDNALEVPVI